MSFEFDDESGFFELRPPGKEPLGQLPPLDWLTSPETTALINVFRQSGDEVRFVGGWVRDALAHRPVTDIDLATPLPPDQVMALLAEANIKVIPTGIDHGTVTAIVGDAVYEITTLRRDEETDGRHARVAFTDDWYEDAKRRDFTINAMSADRLGAVYDPFDGIPDLAHGRIRFIGRADDRVQEDYLRILRYFRFYGRYGRPPADKLALAACRSYREGLRTLSGERIRDEMMKILMAPHPEDLFVMMRGLGVLQEVLPEATDLNQLRMKCWLTNRAVIIPGLETDAVRRLGVAIAGHGDGTPLSRAEAVADRWRLSNKDRDRLVGMLDTPVPITADLEASETDKLIHRLGAETVRDAALVNWACELTIDAKLPSDRTQAYVALVERCAQSEPRLFPLRGNDVLALGLPPGPAVGELLAHVERWWEDNNFAPDREACLDQLKSLLPAS